MEIFQTKKYCSGIVLAISPILHLKAGNIEIKTVDDEMEYIGLTGDSVALHDTIKVGLGYKFVGLDQMILKGFQCHEGGNIIFVGDSMVELIELPVCVVTNSMSTSLLSNTRTSTIANLNLCKIPEMISNLMYHNISILSSCEAVTNAYDSIDIEVFMFRYIDVEGVVMRFFKDGWIEMETHLSPSSGDSFRFNQSKKPLFIYFAHHRGEGIDKFLQKGTVIHVRQVLPVFLWGKLQGFATTVRSNVTILSASSLSNSSSLLTLNSMSTATKTPRFSISSRFRSRCSMYSAWRALLTNKVMRLLNEKGGSMTGSSSSKQTNKCPYNLVEILDKIEQCFLGRQAVSMLGIPDRTVQMEFMDLTYGPLFTVRAGNDTDWLSSHLPEFYSLSEAFRLLSPAMPLHPQSQSLSEEASPQIRSVNQSYYKVFLEDIQAKTLRSFNRDDGGATSKPWLHDVVVMGRVRLISINEHSLVFEISDSTNNSNHSRVSTKCGSVFLYLSAAGNKEITNSKNEDEGDLSWEHSFGVTSRMIDQEVLLFLRNPKAIIQTFFSKKDKNNHNYSMQDKSLENCDINSSQYRSQNDSKNNDKRNRIMIYKMVRRLDDFLVMPLLDQQEQPHHPSEADSQLLGSHNISSGFTSQDSHSATLNRSDAIPCIGQSKPKRKTQESITNSLCSTTSRSTGLTVRQVLLLNMSAQSKSSVSLDVIGVVSRMVPLSDAKYSPFARGPSALQSRLPSPEAKERWMVTLRDERMEDTVELYLSLKELSIMTIGMVVCFRALSLCLSEASSKKKSLYLKYVAGRSAAVILGIVPESQLQCLCEDFNWATDNFPHIPNSVYFSPNMLAFLTPPPFATISHIVSPSNSHSRCLWTIVASVEALKSWKIYLRCKACRRSAERRGGWEQRKNSNAGKKITFPSDWVCKNCITDRLTEFEIWWLVVMKIGDGSSECMIFLEGEREVIDAFNPLRSLSLHGEKFSRLKGLIKRAVFESGYVKYDTHYADSFPQSRPEPTPLDSTIMLGNQVAGAGGLTDYTIKQQNAESDSNSGGRNRNDNWLWEGNKPQSYHSNVGINKLVLLAMQEFLSFCQFDSVLLELQVRHAFPTFIDQFADDVNQPVTKLVKMQRMCEDFPDRQTFRAEVATLCAPLKYLDVVHVKSSRKTDVTDIAYKLLNLIENS